MDTDRNVESVMTPLTHSGMSPKWMGLGASKPILSSRADSFGPQRHDEHRKNQDLLVDCTSLIGDFLEPDPSLVFFCTTTLQNPRAPRGLFPERGCVRGAPAAAGWTHGTPLIPAGACGDSGPLRLVLGGHSRAPWGAAPPRCVHRVSAVLLPVLTEWRQPDSQFVTHPYDWLSLPILSPR